MLYRKIYGKLALLLATILIITGALSYLAAKQYKYLEFRDYDYSQLNWAVEPGKYESLWSLGYGDEFCHYSDEDHLSGVIDAQGNVIIPYDYFGVYYYGGDYIAVYKNEWALFDTKGNKLAYIDNDKLSYAGGKYFIEYGNLNKQGFKIIDAAEGKIVKEYPDYYNAIKLDDGNWYISTNFNNHIALRSPYNGDEMDIDSYDDNLGYYYGHEYYSDKDKKYEPAGFFTDENFNKLFDGKEYNLQLAGNGYYIADEVKNNKIIKRVLLNGQGELYTIKKSDRINKHIQNAIDTLSDKELRDTLAVDKSGNRGLKFADEKRMNGDYWDMYPSTKEEYILYFDKKYNEIIESKELYGTVKYYVKAERYICGLENANGEALLDAAFYDIKVLAGGKTAIVKGENKGKIFEAIVKLERR